MCLYMFLNRLNRSKVEQPDAMQHNGMANSEMDMCKWKNGCEKSLAKSIWKLLPLKMGSTLH